jgi:hypothetical protein
MIENKHIGAGFNAQQLFEYLSKFTPEERKAKEIFIRIAPENSSAVNVQSMDYIENSSYGFFGEDIPCLIFNTSNFAPKQDDDDIGIYEIWREGFRIQGESGPAEQLGIASGKNFREAVLQWYEEHPDTNFNPDTLTFWGCNHYPTEQEARKTFG